MSSTNASALHSVLVVLQSLGSHQEYNKYLVAAAAVACDLYKHRTLDGASGNTKFVAWEHQKQFASKPEIRTNTFDPQKFVDRQAQFGSGFWWNPGTDPKLPALNFKHLI